MEGNLPDILKVLSFLEQPPAAAILILPPYYSKPVSSEGLRLFYEPAIAALATPLSSTTYPSMPYPYRRSWWRNCRFGGLKNSGGEPGYAEALLTVDKGVLLGTEDDLWERWNSRVQGAISTLANFIPEHIVEMYRRRRLET